VARIYNKGEMNIVQEAEVRNKKVLVRADYNVPIKDGKVVDSERIKASLETIKYLLKNGATVMLCSHLGRPKSKNDQQCSLKPLVPILEKLIKESVHFCDDCIGTDRQKQISKLVSGDIILLENLRFHPEEENNDPAFAKKLTQGCDIYVNDAFSASHREHASIVGVTDYLPSFAGFQMQREVENLTKVLINPKRPFVLVMGGAKIADKIPLIDNMMGKIDTLVLGGAIANTFLLAKGYYLGKSIVEPEALDTAKKILIEARDDRVEVLLPQDCVVSKDINSSEGQAKEVGAVTENELVLDIGKETVDNIIEKLKYAETIFWNGPMGYAETPAFAKATRVVGQAIANSNAYSVIGGGDTIAAVDDSIKKQFSYISMAGGASLEFLSGKILPGIKALE